MRREDLVAGLDEMAESTARLLRTVEPLTDDDLRGGSLLPGWSRGHVLTHVARNADGLANLALAARTGEERPMYEGGRAGRAAAIEAGASRGIDEMLVDLRESAERLLRALADLPDDGLAREVTLTSGATAYGWEIPYLRVREVEIHHVDLGLGYTPADWSPAFARRTLDQIAPVFREARDCPVGVLEATDADARWEVAREGPVLSGPRTALVAWLTGRSTGDGLRLSDGNPVPPAPPWA